MSMTIEMLMQLLCRSACPKDEPGYASQQTVYNDLGKDLLDHSFEGFNTCIFACELVESVTEPYDR